jgi:two-component system phosphate regulon sensor histidine kinase PhoR
MSEPERGHPSLRTHLLVMLGIFAALFLALTLYLYSASRSLFSDALQHELSGDLEWMASTLREHPDMLSEPPRVDSLCKALSTHKGFRVTVIDSSGKVIGDSHVPFADLGKLENHRDRPEVAMARASGWGYAWRYSHTLRLDMMYAAKRLPDGADYLRIAAGPVTLKIFQRAAMRVFALFLGLFLAAAVAVTWWISRSISAPLLHLTAQGNLDVTKGPLEPGAAAPRWDARFSEADALNRAFQVYVDEIRSLAGKVAAERDRLVAVLDQLEEGILILSENGAIKAANPSSLRLLGIDAAAASGAVGRPFGDLVRMKPLAQWVQDAADPGRPPVLHVDKGPEAPFDLLCHLGPLDPRAGSPRDGREYLLTLINVTEFKHLDRVKSEFVANASHELKTPLSSIKGYAEALLEGALGDAKVREPFVRKIHNNALRLERLVQDLLSLSQIEANPVPKETEPLPLRGYVNAAANLHRQGLDSAGLRLENHVPEGLRLLMEPRDLELILNNLVGNAVKYNRPAGKVKIGVEEEGKKLKLFVKDTGIGIPEPMLPRIFERFYRADASRAQKDGTGLGLAIVKHAAHKYGMTVSAESTLGEGSRFVIEIPDELIEERSTSKTG